MECVSCQAPNRSTALYCKVCGSAFTGASATAGSTIVDNAVADFGMLVGLGDLKEAYSREIRAFRNMRGAGLQYDTGNLHSILMGNTGTGKNLVVDVLSKVFFKNGVTTKPDPVIVAAANFPEFTKNLAANVAAARGCILYIDSTHQLVPAGYQAGQSIAIDRLYLEMEKSGGDPIVILGSKPDGFREYLLGNQEVNNRFPLKFYLPDMTIDSMNEMALRIIRNKKFEVTDRVSARLKQRLTYLFRHQQDTEQTLGIGRNGFLVQKEMNNIISEHFTNPSFHLSPMTLLEEDIKGKVTELKTTGQVLEELNEFIGMDGVKEYIRKMVNLIRIQQQDAVATGQQQSVGTHMVITGNPGTGKTTLARKLGEVMASAGVLSSGHVIETDRSKLVGQYTGETALLVQKYCNEAMGGILFVDEAYALKQNDHDSVGQEAIDTLLKRMEDDRDKFMVIAAGYQKEMQAFINSNPGLKSRVKDNFFHLDDYSAEQLLAILKIFLKKGGYQLEEAAEKKAFEHLSEMVRHKSRDFGNGRDVRNLYETIITNRAARLTGDGTNYDMNITAADIPGDTLDLSEDKVRLLLEELNALTGLEEVKGEISGLIDYLEGQRMRSGAGGRKHDLNLHFVFTGNPGTGKTTVARILANIFKGLGFLSKGQLIEVTDKDLMTGFVGQAAIQTNKVIDTAMGGVLFIDEAYTLTPKSNSYGQEVIDTLLKRMEDDRGKFIVIAAGYTKEMRDFLEANPGLDSRFSRRVHFEDYQPESLLSIMENMIKSNGLHIAGDARARLARKIQELYALRDKNFANARTIRNEFEKILQQQSVRIVQAKRNQLSVDTMEIAAEDIAVRADDLSSADIDTAMSELNTLTGLSGVKEFIAGLVDFLQGEKIRSEAGVKRSSLNLHFIFSGNPGTGKTTVARLLAKIFKGLGILPKGQLIEVTDKDLVAGFVGQTAANTNKIIDSAMGGVLFIDEAYTLSPKQNGFGSEVIDTLMKRMEDDRGKFIVIAAGYSREMENFLDSNPGLDSRFTQKVNFEDYSPGELENIMHALVKSGGLKLSEGAKTNIGKYLEELHRNKDNRFANGRTVRMVFEDILRRQSRRLVQMKKLNGQFDPAEIAAEDIPGQYANTGEASPDVMEELSRLTGLDAVKSAISSLISFLEMEKLRARQGGKATQLNLHFIFKGRPGTGKTTVARILGKIFKQLELLPKGHVVEVDRKDLVGQYVGQTAPQTAAVIDRAMGGILFIDEAYTLMPEDGRGDFGKEAIDTLLKRMEDDKGKFIVIAAGYTDAMDRFIQANEGLASRFTKEIVFEDYSPPELTEIFRSMLKTKGMEISPETEEGVLQFFTSLHLHRDSKFANGRTVRNVFEKSLQRQADRLLALKRTGQEIEGLLTHIETEDIV